MNSTAASSSVIRRMASLAPGSLMKRSIFCGMRISAFIALPSFTRASWSASEKPRLGMNGNGCAGSIASGVSSGKMWERKYSSSQARSAFLSCAPSISVTPTAASSGRNSIQRCC